MLAPLCNGQAELRETQPRVWPQGPPLGPSVLPWAAKEDQSLGTQCSKSEVQLRGAGSLPTRLPETRGHSLWKLGGQQEPRILCAYDTGSWGTGVGGREGP